MSILTQNALSLIQQVGKTLTLKKRASGSYDVSTGAAPVTETSYSCKGMVLSYRARERDGTMVQIGDVKIVIAAQGLAVEPTQADFVVDGSILYRLVNVQRIEEAGANVIFTCQARRG